jgi:hypothetical protein
VKQGAGEYYRQCVVSAKVATTDLMLQEPHGSRDFATRDLALAGFRGIHDGGSNVRLGRTRALQQEGFGDVKRVGARARPGVYGWVTMREVEAAAADQVHLAGTFGQQSAQEQQRAGEGGQACVNSHLYLKDPSIGAITRPMVEDNSR